MPSESKLKSVILINLDRDADRLERMRAQFDHQGIHFIRHSALLGLDALAKYPDRFANSKLSAGEIGCFGSHLEIADKIASGEYASPALIIEDDLTIPEQLNDIMNGLLAHVPEDWEIIRLSNVPRRGIRKCAEFQIADRIYSIFHFRRVQSNTGAYLISKAGARKLALIRPSIFPIDQHLKRRWLTNLTSYSMTPIIPQLKSIRSTINMMAAETKTPSRFKANAMAHIAFYLKHAPHFVRYHLGLGVK